MFQHERRAVGAHTKNPPVIEGKRTGGMNVSPPRGDLKPPKAVLGEPKWCPPREKVVNPQKVLNGREK